jgi:uncharacterized protein YeaO (DUF488 family)
MTIRIVRLGTDRAEGEGVRLGTVRRPPRGVKKSEWAKQDFFDAWLPELSPSAELVRGIHALKEATPAQWNRFARSYRHEMSEPAASRLLDAFALLSQNADFSMGCYCEDEQRCHRSVLRELLLERGARVVDGDL